MKIKPNQIWTDGKKIILILDAEEILKIPRNYFVYFDDGKYKYSYSYKLFLSLFKKIGKL